MPKRKMYEVLISDLISMNVLMTETDFEMYLNNNYISCINLKFLYKNYIKQLLMM